MADATHLRLRFDTFDLDEANARLTCNGQALSLAPKAFAVLCVLARQPGQLVTKNALLDAVWGHRHVSESVLKTIVSELRAALADDAKRPRYIETASRLGYRFIARIGQAPLPVASVTPPAATGFIGRARALTTLRAAWERAFASERQLVFVAGEPGIGKTTLIDSFVRELDAGVAVFGQCVEHVGTGEPYLPILEALRELTHLDPGLATMMRSVAPTWAIQMPWLLGESERSALHRELAGAHPDRMVREMRELLDRYTAKRPMVFVLEDMHWSDLGTLRMMEHFARRPRPVRLLWIASFRLTQVNAENHPLRELRQELRVQRLCEEILLDPFSESEVGAYLESRMPQARFPESFVRRLHAHTDGLPLFVANVTDTLLAQVDDPATAAEWLQGSSSAPLPVPESLVGAIERQIGRMSSEMQSMLEAASVCGMEFRAGVVADLLQRDAQWLRERCDDLVRYQSWLRHDDMIELPDGELDSRYSFLHALYQHVFYHRLTASQRAHYHRRIARAIEKRRSSGESVPPAELALHCERGHDLLAAARYYAAAAENALGHFAPKDALYVAEHGLALLPRCAASMERSEVELVLAGHAGVAASLLHGMASPQARALLERVKALCDVLPQTPARAVPLDGLGWTFYVRGEYAETLELAQRLEDIAVSCDDPVVSVLAGNLRGVTLVAQGELSGACECLSRAIEQCQELNERVPLASVVIDPEVSMRMNIALPLLDCGLADQARSHVASAAARAHEIGQPMALMLAHWASAMLEVRLDNPDGVARHAALLADIVERAMIAQGQGPSLWLRGWAEARAGNPRTGHAHILEGFACHARLGMYAGCTEVLGYAAEALIEAKDWHAAQAQLEEAFALARRIGERLALPMLHLLQARIALSRQDRAAARASMLDSLREAKAQQALGLELKALTQLVQLDREPKDVATLAAAYQKVTEGFDTPLYRCAGELLKQ
jgi:DNA-binding winged helix-turn-helix (wHTH) protein/tetratricopeptide (TPR) repeat protein